jgi:putative flippase GtrA
MTAAAGSFWPVLGRHQISAAAATTVDFATMVLLVERLGIHPAPAAVIGSVIGAVVNFQLGRAWVFRRQVRPHGAIEVLRYAVVSGTSALLNGAGEHILHAVAGEGYVLARVVVSVSVGLLWNFPMQRSFVFRPDT